ncbi:helix-turn-helix domain-containing protein [soil metagenome]
MSDDAVAGEPPVEPPAAPRHPGQMLADRRDHAGLSVADVVSRLKIPARLINAIEAGRWNEVGTPAILRGFVRVYARALDLDPTPLVQALPHQEEPSATLSLMPTLTAPMPSRPSSRTGSNWWARMTVVALVVVAAALGIGWLGTHSVNLPSFGGDAAPPAGAAAAPGAPATDSTAVEINTSPSQALDAAVPAGAQTTAPVNPGTPATETTAAPLGGGNSPSNPGAALYLRSTQDSWIEVATADGRVLLKGILAANDTRSIDADGKLSVVVGNVHGVTLSRRGTPVDLLPYAKGGNVARMTLD